MSSSVNVRRVISICALVSCLYASQLAAQVGPIQPVMLASKEKSKTLKDIPDFNGDFVVPVEVTVGADGIVTAAVVSTPSGNEQVDATAVSFMKEKKFLPGLDESGAPAEAKINGTVSIGTKGINKTLTANVKPPPSAIETARVRKLLCKDFLWETARLRNEAGSTDLSREIMPFVSARMYMIQKKLPKEAEAAFWEKWPAALEEAGNACNDAPATAYFEGVLVPTLDKATG